MKKLLIIFISTLLFIGCSNMKTEKAETEKVEGWPATVELYVINKTDKPIYWKRTAGMDANNVYDTIAVGSTLLSNSNTHNATSFMGKIWPPKSVTKPSPDGGDFAYEYGYWENTMHINNANKGGGPMPGNAKERSANWVYELTWKNDPMSINNTVTITTKAFTPAIDGE
jgi:hypothetical protein